MWEANWGSTAQAMNSVIQNQNNNPTIQ
jgi:hypothetical protein